MNIKRIINKNYKLLCLFVIGVVSLIALSVSAAILLQPEEVSFISDKTSQTTVKGALDELYEIAKGDCPVGHICTTCGAGTYANQTTMECVTCPTGYTSDAGAGKEGDCYIQTTAGQYIATAGDSTQTNCPANYYCASTKVYYGSAGGSEKCTGSYSKSAAGSKTRSNCYLTTTGGYYINNAYDESQTICPANYYCQSSTIYYGRTGSISSCSSGYTSSAGSSSSSQCLSPTYTYTKTGNSGFFGNYTCNRSTGQAIMTSCWYGGSYTLDSKECDGGSMPRPVLYACTTSREVNLYNECNTNLGNVTGGIYVPGGGLPQTESCS